MHFFSQYRGLRRENYVLFFGRIVTNMGSMVWPMLTMILNQKLGYERREHCHTYGGVRHFDDAGHAFRRKARRPAQ